MMTPIIELQGLSQRHLDGQSRVCVPEGTQRSGSAASGQSHVTRLVYHRQSLEAWNMFFSRRMLLETMTRMTNLDRGQHVIQQGVWFDKFDKEQHFREKIKVVKALHIC